MKVCLILEGCYPYIRGGVSTWAQEYMKSRRNTEFVLWTVHAQRESVGKSLYDIPDNVVEMREIFLADAFAPAPKGERISEEQAAETIAALSEFLSESQADWSAALQTCHRSRCSISSLARSESFLANAVRMSESGRESIGLSDVFYGLRSMLLPVYHILRQSIPQADVYHSAVAGYGGLLGSLAHLETGKPFILTEHGIYPREREEELMQADWVSEDMKDVWIRLFYNMSRCAYYHAERVTSLFSRAMQRQCEIGCSTDKCRIIPNGIHFERFGAIDRREDDGFINIGAFIRFAPIKDVKTLLYAFHSLSSRVNNAVLYIMGGTDDPDYEQECRDLINRMGIRNVRIEGHVDTAAYLRRMDMTVMTSISEGQPLAILESLAAGRPCVSTNVGNCMELLERPEDEFGPAGLCCTPMDTEGIAAALERLCRDRTLREQLGRNGRARVANRYTHDVMMARYFQTYEEVLVWRG